MPSFMQRLHGELTHSDTDILSGWNAQSQLYADLHQYLGRESNNMPSAVRQEFAHVLHAEAVVLRMYAVEARERGLAR